jgi:hypothetical protein
MSENIQVEIAVKTEQRAGNIYTIDVSVSYNPVRQEADVQMSVRRHGFDGALPGYRREVARCTATSTAEILQRMEAEDLVWSMAVGVARSNQNAAHILDSTLDRLLGMGAQASQ